MSGFNWAIKKLEEGYKVRRPCWEEDSYWILGKQGTIKWKDGTNAHIHTNQIRAKDFEIYKEVIWKGTQKDIDDLAKYMHERYEMHAKQSEWKTQKKCRVEFDDLPKENKEVMRAMAKDMLIWRAQSIKKAVDSLN